MLLLVGVPQLSVRGLAAGGEIYLGFQLEHIGVIVESGVGKLLKVFHRIGCFLREQPHGDIPHAGADHRHRILRLRLLQLYQIHL